MTFTLKMSDINSDTSQQVVDIIIKEALKVWEAFVFEDMGLWKILKEDFEGLREQILKSASTHHLYKL